MKKVTYLIATFCAISFASFAQSIDNEVFIKQLVGANEADVQQGANSGFAEDNLAKVYQKGDGNGARILQGITSSIAEDNTATLTQNGDDNQASILQGFGESTAEDNTATLTQNGNDNGATLQQGTDFGIAEDNTATLTQNGDANEAFIHQGSGSAFVRTSPDGEFLFKRYSDVTALRSEATIRQHGDDHYAVGIQAGTNDMIDIQQSGVGSFARVSQGVLLPE